MRSDNVPQRGWPVGRARRLIALLSSCVTLSSCADATGPGDGAYRITLAEAPGAVLGWGPNWDGPLIACLFPIEVRATGRDRSVTWHGATLRRYQGATRDVAGDTVPISAQDVISRWQLGDLRTGETHEFTLDLRGSVPFEAVLELRYSADSQEKKAAVRVTCGPRPPRPYEPPVVAAPTVTAPAALRPGDAVQVTVRATSTYGLMRTSVSLSGPFERADSWLNYGAGTADHSITYVVPPDAEPDVPISVTATTFDAAGEHRAQNVTTTIRVADLAAPVLVDVSVSGGVFGWIAPGDPLHFRLRATDDLALERASVDIEVGTAQVMRMTLPFDEYVTLMVDDDWATVGPITFRVRDRTGKTSNTVTVPADSFRFHPAASRTTSRFALSTQYGEPVYDTARERLYFADGPRVGRLDLETMTPVSSIPLPLAPGEGISGEGDLSLSGDSLIVVLPYANALAIADLAAATPVATRVDVTAAPRSGGAAVPVAVQDVKVGADGTVFVLARQRNVDGDQVLAVSLSTGVGRWLDLDLGPIAWEFEYLSRDPSRENLLLLDQSCPRTLQVATRALQPCGSLITPRFILARPRFNPAGDRMWIGSYLYGLDLRSISNVLRIFEPPYSNVAPAPDGSTVWVAEEEWLTRMRLADGDRLDRMPLGSRTSALFVSPRGHAIYVIDEFRSMVTRIALP